jgi:phosphorylcholine metabolism protein LicD
MDTINKYPVKIQGSMEKVANDFLLEIVEFMDENKISYFLEGGTLLGIVRDARLLPWDHDLDISIMSSNEELTLNSIKNSSLIFFLRYRITIHNDKEGVRLIKIKRRWIHYLAQILPFIFKSRNIVLDVFIKREIDEWAYWSAAGKKMRVSSMHYKQFDTIKYRSKILKIPFDSDAYLTKKYGNWDIPNKNWHCTMEKTIY